MRRCHILICAIKAKCTRLHSVNHACLFALLDALGAIFSAFFTSQNHPSLPPANDMIPCHVAHLPISLPFQHPGLGSYSNPGKYHSTLYLLKARSCTKKFTFTGSLSPLSSNPYITQVGGQDRSVPHPFPNPPHPRNKEAILMTIKAASEHAVPAMWRRRKSTG